MTTSTTRFLLSAGACAALLGGAVACTSASDEPSVAFTVPGKGPSCSPAKVTNPSTDQKPSVTKGEGEPPAELVKDDLKVGDGEEAKTGDKVQMEYVGVLFADGSEFDSSWSRGAEPFTVPALGGGSVIKGWDEGIPGMKVGGRRKLVIPAAKAYGAAGSPPKIPANATLIFVVDLLQVCHPSAAVTTLPTVPGSTPGSTPGTAAGSTGTTPGTAAKA